MSIAAEISKVPVPVPPKLITLLFVPGFIVNAPVPPTAAVQDIVLAIRLKSVTPLMAAVLEIEPVPAFRLRAFPAPAMAPLSVMLLLLAVVFRVVPAASVIASVLLPKVIEPVPPEVAEVEMVPAKVIALGWDTVNAPVELPKLNVALELLPRVRAPVVSKAVVALVLTAL